PASARTGWRRARPRARTTAVTSRRRRDRRPAAAPGPRMVGGSVQIPLQAGADGVDTVFLEGAIGKRDLEGVFGVHSPLPCEQAAAANARPQNVLLPTAGIVRQHRLEIVIIVGETQAGGAFPRIPAITQGQSGLVPPVVEIA